MRPESSIGWITFIFLIMSQQQIDSIFGNLGLQLVESFRDSGPQCPRASNCTCYDGNDVELYCPTEANLFTFNKNLAKIMLCNSRHKLKTLPDYFLSALPKLEEVYLNNCELEIIPETMLKNSTQIRNISMNNNHISIIPPYLFCDQMNLLTLDLNSNQITFIPDEAFKSLINLEQLNLDNNTITNISRGLFSKMQNLKILTMKNNKLLYIDDEAFAEIENLNYVNMAYNQIHAWFLTFEYLLLSSSLTYLNVSHNNITVKTAYLEIDPWSLSNLDLSYNKIEKVKINDVDYIDQYMKVDLRNNNISEILFYDYEHKDEIEVFFNDVSKLNLNIFIEDNPLKCYCHSNQGYLYQNPHDFKVRRITKNTCEMSLGFRSVYTILLSQGLICSLDDPVNGKLCPEHCTCHLGGFDSTLIVNCSNSSVNEIPMLMNITTLHLNHTELHMEGNHMKSLTKNLDYANINDAYITKLFVANNNITEITIFGLLKYIEVLDLRNNIIKNVDKSIVNMLKNSTSLRRLWISGNPIECECSNIEFLSFIQNNEKKIMDYHEVTCCNGLQIANLNIGSLCATSSVVTAVIVLLAIVCLMSGVAIALYYKFNHEIKVFLYSKGCFLFWLEEKDLDKDKIYDAFISFSHKDEDFVINQLMPELEKEPNPLKICVHFRDWIPGEYIPTQIIKSVEESRRTIVVLSPNFLESVWGKMEFRTAHCNALKEGRTRVIVILYGDIGETDKLDPELQAYLTMNTYVKWGDAWFWHNLKYALPHLSGRKT